MRTSILIFLILLSPISLLALPLGNPVEPALFARGIFFTSPRCDCDCWFGGLLALRAGYYGDFVFNRKFTVDGPGAADFDHGIKTTRVITNAGYLALNFCKRADIFATLGATRISLETNEGAWTIIGRSNAIVEFKDAFSWSVGVRALLYSWNCWKVGIEGQYFSTRPDFNDYLFQFLGGQIIYFDHAPTTHYSDWQIGTGISYMVRLCDSDLAFVPYVGVKWAHCKFNTHNFPFEPDPGFGIFTIFNTKAKHHWGFPIGLSLTFKQSIELNVETRWGDERALSIKGEFEF